MCNSIHSNSEPISKRGLGYKLMELDEKGNLISYYEGKPYLVRKDGWICYTKKSDPYDNPKKKGFAFFPTVKGVMDSIGTPIFGGNKVVICQIEYGGGLGMHKEDSMGGILIGICRRFRILQRAFTYSIKDLDGVGIAPVRERVREALKEGQDE